ncbi:hypothetical protein JCM6882_002954 [Rhodosporidiobolus microsporus]
MSSPTPPTASSSQPAHAGTARPAQAPSSISTTPLKPPAPRPTHFLCLPLVTPTSRPQLASSLAILRNALPSSIPQQVLRPVGSLHLTIGVCALRGKAEVERAKRVLERQVDVEQLLRQAGEANGIKAVRGKDGRPPPLVVDLTSLHSMHSPKSTSILFAAPHDPTDRLQRFGEALRDAFIEKGILLPQLETVEVVDDEGEENDQSDAVPVSRRKGKTVQVERERDLKLHATLVNGVYALEKKKAGGKGGGGRAPPSSSSAQPLFGTPISSLPRASTPPSSSPPRTTPPAPSASTSSSTSTSTPKFSSRGRFDARDLLSLFADQVWARGVHIEAVTLCEVGAKKVLEPGTGRVVDEEYRVVARRELP